MSEIDHHDKASCKTCAQAMEFLYPYLDRELTAEERVEVRRHLDTCPPCEDHFVFEEKLKLLVHDKACPEHAPQALLGKILNSLK